MLHNVLYRVNIKTQRAHDSDADDKGDHEDKEDCLNLQLLEVTYLGREGFAEWWGLLVTNHGQDETLCQVKQSLLGQLGRVQNYGTNDYNDFRAFSVIRVETPDAVKWLKKHAATLTRSKLCKGKCSPAKSVHRTRSWEKWKQLNVAMEFTEHQYCELIAKGHEKVPLT